MATIRDLLADPRLGLRLVVDGDVDRPLRHVHVTEIADAASYLAGHELVLTTGLWRRQRVPAADFVASLAGKDVAGIGYGLLEGHEDVPIALIKACRSHGVPLVEVPVRTPFIAISQAFFERWSAQREHRLRRTMQVTADLLSAAVNSDTGEALDAVVRGLSEAVGEPVWISDKAGDVLAHAGDLPEPQFLRSMLAGLGPQPSAIDGWCLLPVDYEGRRDAVIGSSIDTADIEVRARFESVRPIVGLVLARQHAVRETERRLAGEVVSMVLGQQPDAAAARMPYYGLDPSLPLACMVASVEDRDHALGAAEDWLRHQQRPGVIALRGSELMVILGTGRMPPPPFADDEALLTPDGVKGLAIQLSAALRAHAVGVGSVSEGIEHLRRSLVQARNACELGKRRGDGAVVSHDLIASHELLLALQDRDVLEAFRDALLGPIQQYDSMHSSELLVTLRTFLDTGGRWQETAGRLHVHVNTLRHRIERIEDLTDRRLESTADRVDLWLALQAQANLSGGPREALVDARR